MPSPENDNGLPAFMSRGNKNGQASTCCPLIQIQGDQERRNIVKKNRQLHSICVRPAQPDRIYPEYQVHGPIQSLAFGYLVHVYVDVPGGTPMLLQDTKVSVRALRSLSAVINLAVMENGLDADLDHVALPPGDRQAYLNIFQWLDQMLLGGRPDEVTINCSSLVSDCKNMLHIAESLRIHSLIDDMRSILGLSSQHTEANRASCPYCRFSGTMWQ